MKNNLIDIANNFVKIRDITYQTEKPGQGRGKGKGRSAEILKSVGHLQLITTLKIGADCCQLCQYKLTKPNLTYTNPEE